MTSSEDVDAVLQVRPPSFTDADAVVIAKSTFDVAAAHAVNLGSERDQTFMLLDDRDDRLAVMKVSNPGEDPSTLDMEALAVLHIGRVDPDLPIATPRVAPGRADTLDPLSYRAQYTHDRGSNWVRMYDVLPGGGRSNAGDLSDEAIFAWGETAARLCRALRGFFDPNARRTMLWDVQHALRCRPMLPDVRDPRMRDAAAKVLDRYEQSVTPVWQALRGQVVHGDLTLDNVLIDDAGFITGIIDFGDMSYSSPLADLAAVLDSLADGRPEEELFRVARILLDGYQRITPLEPDELRLLGELWAARCAVTIAISSWRTARKLEEVEFSERYNHVSLSTIEIFLALGWDEVAHRLGAPPVRVNDGELVSRRDRFLGPALEPLTYGAPVHMASARGVWMTDVHGKQYLDMYNNVPCVGHTHPRVTEAIARQSRVLNTNMRYLHESAIELAERLLDTCDDSLDTVTFVNSGSEANDLAWRMAIEYSGNSGGLCTDFAYHGISKVISDLSPESWPGGRKPPNVETWVPPDTFRGTNLDTGDFRSALQRLQAGGNGLAATILDGVLISDGIYDLDPSYVQSLVTDTHEAGGLWIADEVQGGHGRTGDAMWSHQRYGITPDFITLGKPMGNGHPVAALITRREIAERFGRGTTFFSTFGGNPVSVASGHAVLDVLRDERVLPRTQAAGEALREALRTAQTRHPVVGDVRGMGLVTGVEIVSADDRRQPDPALADRVKEDLRQRGVLVGTTGRLGHILKVRPPLAFTEADVPFFSQRFSETLESVSQ